MKIYELEPFISYEMLVFLEMLLVFGGLIWFARGQIRACKRDPEAAKQPSSLAADAPKRDAGEG